VQRSEVLSPRSCRVHVDAHVVLGKRRVTFTRCGASWVHLPTIDGGLRTQRMPIGGQASGVADSACSGDSQLGRASTGGRTSRTGTCARWSVLVATLPIVRRASPVRPRVAMAIRSTPSRSATAAIPPERCVGRNGGVAALAKRLRTSPLRATPVALRGQIAAIHGTRRRRLLPSPMRCDGSGAG
jgi:hypothetical protein